MEAVKLLLFFASIWTSLIGSRAESEASLHQYQFSPSEDSLFRQFEAESFENVEKFKSDVVRLLKRQNLYLNSIQSKIRSLNIQEEFKFLIESPFDEIQFSNQLHVSYPFPNVEKFAQINASQAIVSISADHSLNLWTIAGGQRVNFVDSYPLRIHPEDYTCVKVLSFVQNNVPTGWINYRRADFRLVVVTLWHWNRASVVGDGGRILITDDMITVHVFNGYLNPNGAISSLKPLKMSPSSIQAEQSIKLDVIADFDVVSFRENDGSQFWYLSVIQSNDESNAKFQLDLFQLKESKFDRIASLQTNEMINAHRVKLAMFNSQLYLICTYDRSNQDLKYYPIISIYKHVETFDESFLRHETSLRNESQISRIESIHHLPGKDLIFMRQKESIVVYWFNGNTFVFFTEIQPNFGSNHDGLRDQANELSTDSYERKSITNFAVSEMPNSKPLLVTAFDNELVLHYQIYDSFHSSLIHLKSVPPGYRLKHVKAYYWNMDYYICLSFEAFINGYSGSPNLERFTQIRRVVLKTPESNEDIRTYEFCEMDLKRRLENGIHHVMKLDRKSQQLLVINAEKPEIDVDVIVDQTFVTEQVLPEIELSVEAPPKHIGSEVRSFARHVENRLISREKFIENNVALRDRSQTITSSVIFTKPIEAQKLNMLQVDGAMFLNSIPFDVYHNNSLTINGDQTLHYSSPVVFNNGLNVENLNLENVNGIPLKETIDIKSRDSIRINGKHHFSQINLMNGTTAPRLNNVHLSHVFQDRPSDYPGQYFEGRKRFHTIKTDQLKVDSNFNGFLLEDFFDNLIWLKNPNLKSQSLNGSLLHLMDEVSANYTQVDGSVNGVLIPEKLAQNAVRTNVESHIFGPVTIENGATSHKNVVFKGLLNGYIDLLRDVILLNRDQDFTKHTDSVLTFESIASFNENLNFAVLNDLIESSELLTKEDVMKHQQMLSENVPTKPLLYNKVFARDLFVDGNVDFENYALINGYDLSEMFKLLDTVSSFNTPLLVENLFVRGNVKSTQYNNVPVDHLRHLLLTRLRKRLPQTIQSPFNYMSNELVVKNLRFNFTKSGLRFPEDFVKKNANGRVNQSIELYAPKYFETPTEFHDLSTPTTGLINGLKIVEFFTSLIGNSSSKTEVIHGRKRFQNLYINGDVHIESGIVNDNYLDKLVLLNADRNISNGLTFEDVTVLSPNVVFERLKLNGHINGEVVDQWLQDLVHFQKDSTVNIANKHFPTLKLENLFTTPAHPIMGVELGSLLKEAILIDQEVNIGSKLMFKNAKFDNVRSFKTINGFPREYFLSAIVKSSKPIKIDGKKTFHRDLMVGSLISKSSSVNNVNLTELMENSVVRTANQIFTGKPVFLGEVHFNNLNLNEDVYLGEYPLKNYVKLYQKHLEILSPVIFEHLDLVEGDLSISGLLNNYNVSDIARKSVTINPDRSFTLRFNELPFLRVFKNLHLPSVLNGEKNDLKNIVHVGDERPLRNSIIFGDTVLVKHCHVTSLMNGVNMTFLLNDAVYEHLPQVITARKHFRYPLKIVGDLRQANKSPFELKQVSILSGMMNEVNVTKLFHSTVSTQDEFEVFGPKQFSGRIRFLNSIYSPQGLNGARVPEDFYLTFTNETIHGEVSFYKPIHIHRDLDVHLINQVNLTDFKDNVVYIEPTSDGRTGQPEEILSILNFQDNVHVKNLTILDEINDIEVDELLPNTVQNIQIGGLKEFQDKVEPIEVYGDLNVVNVNKMNFDKDLKGDWIDTRKGEPVRIEGTLHLKQPTLMKQLNIGSKLNNFKVDQISGEYFQKLDQQIQRLNQSIGNEISNFNRIGRNLEKNVYTEFLFEIRFLVEIQIFEKPIVSLFPATFSFNQQQFSDLAIIEESIFRPNKTHECFHYQARLYVANSPTRFVSKEVSTFGGHGHASFNMKTLFVTMINAPKEKFILQSTFSSASVCRSILDKSPARLSHHLSYFEQRFSPELLLNLGYFNETLMELSKTRAFSVDQNTKILLVLLKDSSRTKFEIFRIDLAKKLIDSIQQFPNAHISDFDLTIFDGKLFISLVYDIVPEKSSTIMQWNGRLFHLLHTKIDQFLHGSEYRYQKTSFLETPYGLFLAMSTVASASQITECSSFGISEENYIDIWRWNGGQIEHYQRISLGNGRASGNGAEVALATFSKMVYLFAPTGRDSVAIFRHQGSSRFQLWQTLSAPELSSLKVFWHNKSLYVGLGSKRDNQSRLLKALISGASQSMQFFEQSMFDSFRENTIKSDIGAKLE